jgi:hypothetical protein
MWWRTRDKLKEKPISTNIANQIVTNLKDVFKISALDNKNEINLFNNHEKYIIYLIKQLIFAEAEILKCINYKDNKYKSKAEEILEDALIKSENINKIIIREKHITPLKKYENGFIKINKNIPNQIRELLQNCLVIKHNYKKLRILSQKIRATIKILKYIAEQEKLVKKEILTKINH